MREMSLEELREVELELLRCFDDYCRREGIRYFLSNGTLLGAVKYGGFIPWDDDVDVLVPREDYDRLMQNFGDSERYKLFSPERNGVYRFPYAKLCDMTTRKVEENIDNGVELGVDMDIFPLDVWAPNLEEAERQADLQLADIERLAFWKCKKAISVNPIKRLVKDLVLRLFRKRGDAYVQKLSDRAVQYHREDSPGYLGCVVWCIYGRREIIPADVFAQSGTATFEGGEYPIPADYDIYLRSLYGDYTQDPPKEKQKTHHRFRAYRMNP